MDLERRESEGVKSPSCFAGLIASPAGVGGGFPGNACCIWGLEYSDELREGRLKGMCDPPEMGGWEGEREGGGHRWFAAELRERRGVAGEDLQLAYWLPRLESLLCFLTGPFQLACLCLSGALLQVPFNRLMKV